MTHVVDVVRAASFEGIDKSGIVKVVITQTGCAKATAYRTVNAAELKKLIIRRKVDKRYEVRSEWR